jgi:dihydroneopterin aldolase
MARPDVIELRGLRFVAVVGVLPEERERAQPIEVDLDLEVDLTRAGMTDGLDDTVDYGTVCDAVARVAAAEQSLLIERLADRMVAAVLEVDDRIDGVTVAVRKSRPPVPHSIDSTGVRITRRRTS